MKGFFLAAALVACLGLSTAANAADLGGNCCADLEERIAELEATTARKGNRKVSLTVYGQVHAAILWHDIDGIDSEVITQSGTSTSRFGFKGEAKIGANAKAGYVLEVGVNQEGTPWAPADDLGLSVRHSALWLEGAMGRVTLGHTSQATDTIDEISFGNTTVASKLLSLQPFSNAYLGGLDLPFDGGRMSVARYDSPVVGGFIASAAWGGDDVWDAALRFAGEFSGFKVAAAVGYRDEMSALFGVQTETITAAGSVQHVTSGLFVSGMYGSVDFGGPDDLVGYHVQGGIEWPLIAGVGKTTAYGEWGRVEIGGDEADMFGAGVVQSIDAAAMDLYIAYRQYDVLGEDVQTATAGARIKF